MDQLLTFASLYRGEASTLTAKTTDTMDEPLQLRNFENKVTRGLSYRSLGSGTDLPRWSLSALR